MLVVVKARPIEKQIFRKVFVNCDHWTKKVFLPLSRCAQSSHMAPGGEVEEEKADCMTHVLALSLLCAAIHGCQMAKFDPFLSLDCATVEGVGAQSKERKGSNFAA